MKALLTISLGLLTFVANAETTNLTNKCSWVPPQNKNLTALQSLKKVEEANNLPERDKDFLQVTEKGRLYFHSLPDESCKADIFIVKGDTVQIIDTYPNSDLSFNNSFARVIYFSKNIKGDVIGWVKMTSLRRLTESDKRN